MAALEYIYLIATIALGVPAFIFFFWPVIVDSYIANMLKDIVEMLIETIENRFSWWKDAIYSLFKRRPKS
jgi:hypothetical protein